MELHVKSWQTKIDSAPSVKDLLIYGTPGESWWIDPRDPAPADFRATKVRPSPHKYCISSLGMWLPLEIWGAVPPCPTCENSDNVGTGEWADGGPRKVVRMHRTGWLHTKRSVVPICQPTSLASCVLINHHTHHNRFQVSVFKM